MTGNGAYGAATSFCEEKIKESIPMGVTFQL